jgi:hypothetical protein
VRYAKAAVRFAVAAAEHGSHDMFGASNGPQLSFVLYDVYQGCPWRNEYHPYGLVTALVDPLQAAVRAAAQAALLLDDRVDIVIAKPVNWSWYHRAATEILRCGGPAGPRTIMSFMRAGCGRGASGGPARLSWVANENEPLPTCAQKWKKVIAAHEVHGEAPEKVSAERDPVGFYCDFAAYERS